MIQKISLGLIITTLLIGSAPMVFAQDAQPSEDDILNQEATALLPNDNVHKIITEGFNVQPDGDTVVLPDIVSRKKQIVPVLS